MCCWCSIQLWGREEVVWSSRSAGMRAEKAHFGDRGIGYLPVLASPSHRNLENLSFHTGRALLRGTDCELFVNRFTTLPIGFQLGMSKVPTYTSDEFKKRMTQSIRRATSGKQSRVRKLGIQGCYPPEPKQNSIKCTQQPLPECPYYHECTHPIFRQWSHANYHNNAATTIRPTN